MIGPLAVSSLSLVETTKTSYPSRSNVSVKNKTNADSKNKPFTGEIFMILLLLQVFYIVIKFKKNVRKSLAYLTPSW